MSEESSPSSEDAEGPEEEGEGQEPEDGRGDEDLRGDEDARKNEEEEDGGEDGRKPISVRDLMPSPSSRPARRPPERPERRERGRPEPEEVGEAEKEEEPESADATAAETIEEAGEPTGAASVPTPVRVAMDAPPPGDSRPAEELPSRRFEVEGREWIVRISGRTITGTRPDAGALLMHLSFFRPDEPETAVRRLVTVDRALDAFYEEDLRELFDRSRAIEAGRSGSD